MIELNKSSKTISIIDKPKNLTSLANGGPKFSSKANEIILLGKNMKFISQTKTRSDTLGSLQSSKSKLEVNALF